MLSFSQTTHKCDTIYKVNSRLTLVDGLCKALERETTAVVDQLLQIYESCHRLTQNWPCRRVCVRATEGL